MAKLGIALVTYERLDRARQVIGRVIEYTEAPTEIVIAEDGGSDGTRNWFETAGLTVVSGRNRGVCWNKNRGLYALLARGCDTILLLEDDIFPEVAGWEREWMEATRLHDHLAFAHDKIAPQIISGSGTAADPFVNNKATAQCTAVSKRVLRKVGFLDTRFKGYGVGHAEWTSRIKRAGYGFRWAEVEEGKRARANLYITGGLYPRDAKSFRDNASVEANRELFKAIKKDPVFRYPWSSEEERKIFLDEQREAGIDVTAIRSDFFQVEPETEAA